MLVRHLLCGMIVGLFAATAGALVGFSAGSVVGFYVLGANAGLAASALGALSHHAYRTGQVAPVVR